MKAPTEKVLSDLWILCAGFIEKHQIKDAADIFQYGYDDTVLEASGNLVLDIVKTIGPYREDKWRGYDA